MDWLAKTLRSMSARLIALFTLALLPLGLIAISQTRQIVEEANSLASASLLARTISAASNEKSMIQEALGAVRGLAAVAGEAGAGPR